MLASVVSGEVFESLNSGATADTERLRRELTALPESWEAVREEVPAERSRNRAERRAEERRRRRGR